MNIPRIILPLLLFAQGTITVCHAQDSRPSYMPEIHGTIRAKYEYAPQTNRGRSEVRNARVSVNGKIVPQISYKAEIDLSDEGKIKMLDAYARFSSKSLMTSIAMGQMRVPFTIDAHRSPHRQYFANRSFIAKQVGNVRDVGVSAAHSFGETVPVTVEGGIFNGSGLTDQKDYWTRSYNFSVKTTVCFLERFTAVAGVQKTRPEDISIIMWNAGAFYHTSLWHIEAEYLRKNYSGGAFPGVNAIDAFASRRFPVRKYANGISVLARYDYMSDHSDGIKDENGVLTANDAERHRLTFGTTLHFGTKKIFADLRVNYEKYFYNKSTTPNVSERDKIVVELMCRF
ncbi:porin [Prevotella sp. PINT]|jgi:Phosphate-selective porin O and P.|uniref:porin n=1 Tax=Palleniella intestinalis TaxID=2736291 RepID=UPI001553418E|nr:porin [Palleniella intestinalis]NPD81254.1 porin [Palleniella intestinalis]